MPSRIMVCYTRLIEFVWQFFSRNSSLVNIPKFYLNVGLEFNFIANFVCSTTYNMSAMWSGIIWEMYVQNVLNTKFSWKPQNGHLKYFESFYFIWFCVRARIIYNSKMWIIIHKISIPRIIFLYILRKGKLLSKEIA